MCDYVFVVGYCDWIGFCCGCFCVFFGWVCFDYGFGVCVYDCVCCGCWYWCCVGEYLGDVFFVVGGVLDCVNWRWWGC